MFRNFMANELQITREDIKQWTAEAVAAEVKRQMGQIDVQGIIMRNAKLSFDDQQAVRRIVAELVAKDIVLTMQPRRADA
ncbi:hypothetical protein AC630_23720 [Bradyrhizobium sp. AS23.2]|nr:hypothetical protein AC630_23720 [Bradyrhizobium sp. AS23.2]